MTGSAAATSSSLARAPANGAPSPSGQQQRQSTGGETPVSAVIQHQSPGRASSVSVVDFGAIDQSHASSFPSSSSSTTPRAWSSARAPPVAESHNLNPSTPTSSSSATSTTKLAGNQQADESEGRARPSSLDPSSSQADAGRSGLQTMSAEDDDCEGQSKNPDPCGTVPNVRDRLFPFFLPALLPFFFSLSSPSPSPPLPSLSCACLSPHPDPSLALVSA